MRETRVGIVLPTREAAMTGTHDAGALLEFARTANGSSGSTPPPTRGNVPGRENPWFRDRTRT